MLKRVFSVLILTGALLCPSFIASAAQPMDLSVADSLMESGVRDTQFGRYAQGEANLKEALRIRRKLQGRLHPDCAHVLQLIADLYICTGDYAHAEQYANDALNIQKEVTGEQSREYAAALTTVGRLCLRQNKLKRAETLLRRAQEIYTLRLPDEDALGYALLEYELSEAYLRLGKTTLAEDEIAEALRAGLIAFGEGHPFVASVWARRAEVSVEAQGAGAYALECCDKALLSWQKTIGEDYLPYIQTLSLKGRVQAETGDIASAKKTYRRCLDLCRGLFASSLDYMSEYQREAFWQAMADLSENVFPAFACRYVQDDPELAGFAYDNELFHKGLLLLSSTEVSSAIRNSGDKNLIARWNELCELKCQLAYERLHYSDKSFRQRELQNRINALEAQLTSSASVYRQQQQARQMTFRTVSDALPESRVAVEMFTAPRSEGGRMYYALLLRAHAAQPVLIPMFLQGDLESLLLNPNGKPLPPAMLYDANFQGLKLAKLIWAKLYPHMRQGQTFSFAPCGYLHQLAIEYLPYDAEHAMSDVYTLERISSTRLISQPAALPQPRSAVLVGGVDYAPAEGIPALPASLAEVQAISPILTQSGCSTRLLSGGEASGDQLKALSGQSVNLLHIATHGFFLSDAKNRYPLQKSGLIMAQGKSLTAWDVALLDLRGANLVCLSACETGLGLVSGEGVFGLQRGFKMAGAGTLVMSLWKVDDQATRLLMTTFYRHLFLDRKPKAEAFRLAVQAVRRQFETPEYWAAFILLD